MNKTVKFIAAVFFMHVSATCHVDPNWVTEHQIDGSVAVASGYYEAMMSENKYRSMRQCVDDSKEIARLTRKVTKDALRSREKIDLVSISVDCREYAQ